MIWFFVSFLGWCGVCFSRRYYWPFFFILIVTLSSFRYYVGSDFDDYVILFEHAALGKAVPVEWTYSVLATWFSQAGFNFQAQILLYTCLTFLFIYKGLVSISKDKGFLGVTLFLTYAVFYFPSLSIVRQALSISIAFYGCYRYLHRNNYFGFVCSIILAALFHSTSVVFFICIVLYKIKPNKTYYIVGLLSFFVMGLMGSSLIVHAISSMTGFSYKGYAFTSIPITNPVFYIFTLLVLAAFLYGLKFLSEDNFFLTNVVFFILVMRILAIDYSPFNRLSAAFVVFIPLYFYQVYFSRMVYKSQMTVLALSIGILILGDAFRAGKDYSYYQYSLNLCIYGEPCPVSIVGDLPLEKLLIREELR